MEKREDEEKRRSGVKTNEVRFFFIGTAHGSSFFTERVEAALDR